MASFLISSWGGGYISILFIPVSKFWGVSELQALTSLTVAYNGVMTMVLIETENIQQCSYNAKHPLNDSVYGLYEF